MGLAQLERLDDVIALNRAHHERYAAGPGGPPGPDGDAPPRRRRAPTTTTSCSRSTAGAGPLHRDALLRAARGRERAGPPLLLPRLPPHGALRRRAAAGRTSGLPATAALAERVLQLPTGTAMTPDDVDTVCAIVRLAYEHADAVRAAVAAEGR